MTTGSPFSTQLLMQQSAFTGCFGHWDPAMVREPHAALLHALRTEHSWVFSLRLAGRVLSSSLKHLQKLLTCMWEYLVSQNKASTNNGKMVTQWEMGTSWGCVKKLQIYVSQLTQAERQGPISTHQRAVLWNHPTSLKCPSSLCLLIWISFFIL